MAESEGILSGIASESADVGIIAAVIGILLFMILPFFSAILSQISSTGSFPLSRTVTFPPFSLISA